MNSRLLSCLAIVTIVGFLASPSARGFVPVAPTASTTVNPVIGDAGFIAAFGRAPDVRDDEDLRIAAHLSYVEILLRQRPTDDLSPQLRAERERNIQRLHDYRMRGVFPRNRKYAERRPCFIDDDGRICAVGFLVEQSAGRDVAEGINGRFQYARIDQMRSKILDRWIERSGLTRREVAMIQPTYNFPIQHSAEPIPVWPGLLVGVTIAEASGIESGYAPPAFGAASTIETATNMGTGYTLGINGAYKLTEGQECLRAVLHLGYTTSSTTIRGWGYRGPLIDPSGTEATLPLSYCSRTTHSLLGGDLQCALMLNNRLGVSAGPSIAYAFEPTRSERLTPIPESAGLRFEEEPGFTYSDNGRTLLLSDGAIPDTRRLRLGLTAGMYAYFHLGSTDPRASFLLIPSISFDYALTDIAAAPAWRTHLLRFGLDVSYIFMYAQ